MTSTTPVILVVEDDYSIRETLREALESENYQVVLAANGQEGLDKLLSGLRPKLVLLDMTMPLFSGRQFLDAVLANSALAPIPVFVVSSMADKMNTAGATGFMKKPVELELLLQWVNNFCRPIPLTL